MKACLVLVLVVAVLADQEQTKFEASLMKIINKLIHGDTDLPMRLPSLRPLTLPPTHVKQSGYTFDISEMKVDLGKLKITNLKASYDDLTVSCDFSIPAKLVASADKYHLSGKTFFFSMDDEGKFKLEIDNLKGTVFLTFDSDGTNLELVDIEFDFTVDRAKTYLTGSSDLINGLINNIVAVSVIDTNGERFARVKEFGKKLVNEYFRGYTPEQLIKIILAT